MVTYILIQINTCIIFGVERCQARVSQSHANGCMTSQCFVKKKFSMWKVLAPNGNILTTLRRWNLPFNSKGSSFYCSGLKSREVFPGNYSGWFPQEIFPNLLEIFPNLCQYFLTCWKYFPTFSRYSQLFWDIPNLCWKYFPTCENISQLVGNISLLAGNISQLV